MSKLHPDDFEGRAVAGAVRRARVVRIDLVNTLDFARISKKEFRRIAKGVGYPRLYANTRGETVFVYIKNEDGEL